MNVFFYASKRSRDAERLQRTIEVLAPKEKLEIYRTLRGLSRRLHLPREDLSIGVLLVTGKKELADILCLRDLLSDMRVILVLPESDYDTNSMAHTLGPRFLTYIDSDFKEVKAVLSRMLQGLNVGQIEEKP